MELSSLGRTAEPLAPRPARQLWPAGQIFDESDRDEPGHEHAGGSGCIRPILSSTAHGGPPIPAFHAASVAPAASLVPGPRWSSARMRCRDACPGAAAAAEDPAEWRTTVMLQRIPPTLDDVSVRRTLDDLGFAGRYDALHVPINRGSKVRFRYAFVNFLTPEDAALCIRECTSKPFGAGSTDAAATHPICTAAYADAQGADFTLCQAAKAEFSPRSRRRKTKQKTKQLTMMGV